VSFGVEPTDRAAVEKAVSITTTPAVEGAWAWIEHDDGRWALDYRPKDYWPSGTQVHVEANVYGVDFGGGYWGREDVTSDFTIGRNQVVIADVNSHEMIVQQDGVTVASYPASYGRGDDTGDLNLVTRSGTHIVMEKFETKLMSNPRYGYTNIPEKWAVRISDNGEFIHANPASTDAQGSSNVTHGCVNLSLTDAESYYDSVLFGDPIEVSGTEVQLGPEDGDIYDWAIPWDQWVTMSGKNS
jgi:lipoprotein-anchoring transpeptidase ErfK/SrfK